VGAHEVPDAVALSSLLADAPKVVGILTGHVHTSTFAGVPVIGAPGVASTLDPHVTDRIRADASYPPGYAGDVA
jgi:Icc protein